MPELPEIETIKRGLAPVIIGHFVSDIRFTRLDLRWPVQIEPFERWIVGHKIVSLHRRGKYLLWEIDNCAHVLFHLGMSGRLLLAQSDDPIETHTHVMIILDGGFEIRFRDPRRFGFIDAIAPNTLQSHPLLRRLGVEPLSRHFNAQYFFRQIAQSRQGIKKLLMDHHIVVGVGNIYANEALFHAKIHPERIGREISEAEAQALVKAVKIILQSAVRKGGTTLNDFRNPDGDPGFFQMDLKVYDRAGEQCPRCKAIIQQIKISSRSSYFCPTCQIQ